MIKHNPILNIDKAIKHYEQKDGVAIIYCCTSELSISDMVFDIFYRESPHPQFGNHYFGLRVNHTGDIYINNADAIENFTFSMIKDSKGNYHYSRSHHDFVQVDRNMIDGGRQYVRCGGRVYDFRVKNGKFKEVL